MNQGIYASPDCITPNRDREPISDLKIWIIEFEVFIVHNATRKGCAVIKAKDANSASQILLKDGSYNGTPNRYSITRIAEIVPSPDSMLLCEQINPVEYDC